MSIDSLFSTAAQAAETPPPPASLPATSPQVCCDLPIDLLDDMPQPFHTYPEEELEKMRRSIAANGVIQRLVVRPLAGRYQIVSGRHRRNGARLAGFAEVPCEIRQLTDDEAEILMIETNLRQRQKLLPSERAWAYRRMLEALNRQGQKDSGTCGTEFHKSRDEVGDTDELSGRQVTNYIRLTYLTSELLDLIDAGKLTIKAGVPLSYLSTGDQAVVRQFFFEEHRGPLNVDLAEKIRAAGEKKALTAEDLAQLFSRQVKPPKRVKTIPLTKSIKQYFRPTDTQEMIIARIIQALELLGNEESR